jgi:hypothetical protein
MITEGRPANCFIQLHWLIESFVVGEKGSNYSLSRNWNANLEFYFDRILERAELEQLHELLEEYEDDKEEIESSLSVAVVEILQELKSTKPHLSNDQTSSQEAKTVSSTRAQILSALIRRHAETRSWILLTALFHWYILEKYSCFQRIINIVELKTAATTNLQLFLALSYSLPKLHTNSYLVARAGIDKQIIDLCLSTTLVYYFLDHLNSSDQTGSENNMSQDSRSISRRHTPAKKSGKWIEEGIIFRAFADFWSANHGNTYLDNLAKAVLVPEKDESLWSSIILFLNMSALSLSYYNSLVKSNTQLSRKQFWRAVANLKYHYPHKVPEGRWTSIDVTLPEGNTLHDNPFGEDIRTQLDRMREEETAEMDFRDSTSDFIAHYLSKSASLMTDAEKIGLVNSVSTLKGLTENTKNKMFEIANKAISQLDSTNPTLKNHTTIPLLSLMHDNATHGAHKAGNPYQGVTKEMVEKSIMASLGSDSSALLKLVDLYVFRQDCEVFIRALSSVYKTSLESLNSTLIRTATITGTYGQNEVSGICERLKYTSIALYKIHYKRKDYDKALLTLVSQLIKLSSVFYERKRSDCLEKVAYFVLPEISRLLNVAMSLCQQYWTDKERDLLLEEIDVVSATTRGNFSLKNLFTSLGYQAEDEVRVSYKTLCRLSVAFAAVSLSNQSMKSWRRWRER